MVDAPTPHGIHSRWQAVVVLPHTAQGVRSASAHRGAKQILRRLMRTHGVQTAAVHRPLCGGGGA